MAPPLKPDPLRQGIAAANMGNKLLARLHLQTAAEADPHDPLPWLWLGWAAESPEKAVAYLERAAAEGGAEAAKAGLVWVRALLQGTSSGAAPPAVPRSAPASPPSGAASTGGRLNGLRPPEAAAPAEGPRAGSNGASVNGSTPHGAATANGVGSNGAGSNGAGSSGVAGPRRVPPPFGGEDLPVVLAADDSPTIRRLIQMTLAKIPCVPLLAKDGVDALSYVVQRIPDLILLDITMPRMNGYELLKTLKDHPAAKDVPVIMISGEDSAFFDEVKARMAGCCDYVRKPFDSAALIAKIQLRLPAAVR